MDNVYRYHIHGKGALPNGQGLADYGSHGDSVQACHAPIRECEDNLFLYMILHRLFPRLHSRIYIPCWRLYNKILNRDPGPEPEGFDGRQLGLIVIALESPILVACVAGAVALLYNIKSFSNRIIVTSLFNLVFPYLVVFFSKEVKGMFKLTFG